MNVIGADLLVRIAESCDIPAAWRMLSGSSFNGEWLTHTGSAGETPLMAATRRACAELVAMLLLHPDFDETTIKKTKARRDLVEHAMATWDGNEAGVSWALQIVDGIREGKLSQKELDEDPTMAATQSLWFLPRHGEWMPPMTLAEMGIVMPLKPAMDLTGLATVSEGLAATPDGEFARVAEVEKLWYLLLSYARAPEASEERLDLVRHIRSIGWTLWFWGGREALLSHSYLVALMSRRDEMPDRPGDDDEVHAQIRARGLDVSQTYAQMAQTLGMLWNKTGSWVIFERTPGRIRV